MKNSRRTDLTEEPSPTKIEALAHKILDEREIKLALHLASLMKKSNWSAGYLIDQILPVYHKDRQTLEPRAIYRHLYYVHGYSMGGHRRFGIRFFIHMMCGHLESCLHVLAGWKRLPFGPLVIMLDKKGILSLGLAEQLLEFNEVVYVAAKHLVACENIPRSIDKRTFGVEDGTFTFVMMRKLSIKLFDLLKSNGVTMPQDWKEFREEWLTWDRKVTMEEAVGDHVF